MKAPEYKRLRKQLDIENMMPVGATLRLINDNHIVSRPVDHKGWTKNKMKALERDDFKCWICGRTTNLHVHHIIPRQEGGTDELENLVTLCSGCHRSVETQDEIGAIKSCVKRAVKEARKSLFYTIIDEDSPQSTENDIDNTLYSQN